MTDTTTAGNGTAKLRQRITDLRRAGRAYVIAQDRNEAAMVKMRAAAAAAALDGLTIAEIARTAGVSRNAVYRALGQRD